MMPIGLKMGSRERSSEQVRSFHNEASISKTFHVAMNHQNHARPVLILRQWYSSFLFALLLASHVSLVDSFSHQSSRRSSLSVNALHPLSKPPSSVGHSLESSCSFASAPTTCWAFKQHFNLNDDKESNGSNRWRTISLFRNNHQHHPTSNKQSRRVICRGWKSVRLLPTSTLLTAAAVLGTVLLAASPPAHAAAASIANFDLSAVTGGASALALSTSQLWDSLTETGFYQAFSLVFVSEIGDKTFFIAGLLAMKTSRLISFVGSMGALAAMTLVSVIIGQIFHAVPSGIADGIPLDDLAAVFAFTFFGIKTLREAWEIDGDSTGTMDVELAEAKETVEGSSTINQVTPWAQIASIFALVFAAEFGDRSFLSTIALSAAQNPVSVAGGAIAAHAVATGIAVSGGSLVAKMLSEKVIGLIGGTLFLVFAVTTALGIF